MTRSTTQFVCGGGPCHGILYLIWYSLSVVVDRVMIYSINLIWYSLSVVMDRVMVYHDTVHHHRQTVSYKIEYIMTPSTTTDKLYRVMIYSILYDTVCLWWWTVWVYTLLILYDTVCLWWWTVSWYTLSYNTVHHHRQTVSYKIEYTMTRSTTTDKLYHIR
jgi:hypothetical protein